MSFVPTKSFEAQKCKIERVTAFNASWRGKLWRYFTIVAEGWMFLSVFYAIWCAFDFLWHYFTEGTFVMPKHPQWSLGLLYMLQKFLVNSSGDAMSHDSADYNYRATWFSPVILDGGELEFIVKVLSTERLPHLFIVPFVSAETYEKLLGDLYQSEKPKEYMRTYLAENKASKLRITHLKTIDRMGRDGILRQVTIDEFFGYQSLPDRPQVYQLLMVEFESEADKQAAV
jgi:hypothetical protein